MEYRQNLHFQDSNIYLLAIRHAGYHSAKIFFVPNYALPLTLSQPQVVQVSPCLPADLCFHRRRSYNGASWQAFPTVSAREGAALHLS